MGFVDLTAGPHLATSGGDTVKIFDTALADSGGGNPLVLSYSPGPPGSQVSAVKWNHTNLVVASGGDDKKISLWHKKGKCLGVLPDPGTDTGDSIEESINSISFSNKSSRYLCSGGSGQIVRIWDLQRKRCIKWLSGHADVITGVAYNCRDEHLASISARGDLILHNLASGARAAELKDPHRQVLRVLDYSRLSRHVLATAGDDGSVHLWDTTARSPKSSWLKQHSAPISGLCLSPSSDKIIATVGLDKKLYTFDANSKRPTSCVPHDQPFSSLAYNDDGTIIAAGTNAGKVVFYDVRAKPQAFTVLNAYNSSEAVTGLSWQRSKPVSVSQSCSDEAALLGGTNDDSVLMPDPLPSSSRNLQKYPSGEETPHRKSLSKVRGGFVNPLKDDMDVFSPLVDVQPFSPNKYWEEENPKTTTKDFKTLEKVKPVDFSLSGRKYPLGFGEDSTTGTNSVPSLSRFGPTGGSSFTSSLLDASSFTPSRTLSQIATSANSNSQTTKGVLDNLPVPGSARLSSYAERLSGTSAFNEGMAVGSPKLKKTGAETREELLNSILNRQEAGTGTGFSSVPTGTELPSNGISDQAVRALNAGPGADQQTSASSSSFSLQLVQRTLEETLGSVQKNIHEDVRNLHIELLRQFHLQEMEMASMFNTMMERQEMLMKEVQLLRKENQQLKQLL
ncbi:hypothetical protein LUZ60_008681 [Juncus effusus]|nr:hypothetical protein LUZ60_008681 [Juncus effusus]